MTSDRIKDSIAGKRILVTGGTGSFGHEIVRALLPHNPAELSIFSRDEKKQYDMQHQYRDSRDLRFILGDVRDLDRVRQAFRGQDIVYHAAALKQVPNCEYGPYEAVRTNIIGAENVRVAALEADVNAVVAISTDKAVKPVNVMGMSKAIQERLMLQPTFDGEETRFVCVRYGNVLGSRGSVVPVFMEHLKKRNPLPITHPGMTRFLLTLPQAVQLVLWATVQARTGELWVRKMPAACMLDLARALALGVTGDSDYPLTVIGTRPGEKMHEVLISEEEMWRAKEMGDHFLIPSWHGEPGEVGPGSGTLPEYSSNSVHRMTQEDILALLRKDGWLESGLAGRRPRRD